MTLQGENFEDRRGEFLISTDRARIDVNAVHAFLTNCYWAAGIPRETVARSIDGSLSFGMYCGERQVGFARVITDRATYAYLGDVYVLEEFRGQDLAKWLMECIIKHPELQGLRRWSLLTRDAHGLYERFGFRALEKPERWMERHDGEVYKRKA
jgi:GNAT superfamily N-acetyltransferase